MKKSSLPLQSKSSGEKQVCGKQALVKLLRWHFGHADFRGKQLDAIEAVLSGRKRELTCYIVVEKRKWKFGLYKFYLKKRLLLSHAYWRRKVDVLSNPRSVQKRNCACCLSSNRFKIIDNLIDLSALMENQVATLKEKQIAAEFLSSTQTTQTKNKIYDDLDSGKPSLRLLYVTPELIATPGFMTKLSKIYARGLLNLIAIDEVHCISTWGHDFRPSYRKLSSLRRHLPDVPILALTATAVPKVQKDVIESLCLRDPLILKSSFNRPNIHYEVRYKDLLDDSYADLCNLLKSSGEVCAIVYCLERTACDDLSAHLVKNGISCAAYHAGLNKNLRSAVLDDWVASKILVVVATVAFGMGIDRKDVRIVCHFNIPKSMESFYQESGRAGRDQLLSKSVLYYGIEDRKKMEFILSNAESKKLQSSSSMEILSKTSSTDFSKMVEYCEGSGCRRKQILESFGEQASASLCKKSCDACKQPNLVFKYLEELKTTLAFRQKNFCSRIFTSSSSNMNDEEFSSEFWNQEDELSGSEDDISESDDDVEFAKSLAMSKAPKKLGLNQKMEILQRAEENYYQNKVSEKQINKQEKNTISEALREVSTERLQNALKQTQQRLGNVKIKVDTSASFLENECYKKYGKLGKSFYYSQVASTVRWLSSTNSTELIGRLGTKNILLSETAELPGKLSPPLDQSAAEISSTDLGGSLTSDTSPSTWLKRSVSLIEGEDNPKLNTLCLQSPNKRTKFK